MNNDFINISDEHFARMMSATPEESHPGSGIWIHRAPECELVGYYGGDESHALSAWTSTRREIDEQRRERIPRLLSMLAMEGHHTPFEKSMLHFVVRTDIATHIHLLKHRIGVSINAESARYKRFREHHLYQPVDLESPDSFVIATAVAHSEYMHQISNWDELCKDGRRRTKERSRLCLPYATMIRADVSFNFRSFMHFMNLRRDKHAQVEVCFLADMMLRSVSDVGDFSASLEAFGMPSRADLAAWKGCGSVMPDSQMVCIGGTLCQLGATPDLDAPVETCDSCGGTGRGE